MAFGEFNKTGAGTPMAEINMIPLIDVMLVLLVIFIITAPLLTHAVKIELPRASSSPNITRPDHISLAIDEGGKMFWNGEPVGKPELLRRFTAAGKTQPQPELHIRADRTTQYEVLAVVMAEAARSGLTRIGFISDPREKR